MTSTDQSMYAFPMGDYGDQMAELVQLELERAQRPPSSPHSAKTKPKSKGIRLKRSIEKFTSKLRFSSTQECSPDPPEDDASDATLTHTPKSQPNASDSQVGLSEDLPLNGLGCIPNHDEILDRDFHCRRIGIENLCLAEQNLGMAQELKLCQETLDSLRRILQQKVDRIDKISSMLETKSSKRSW